MQVPDEHDPEPDKPFRGEEPKPAGRRVINIKGPIIINSKDNAFYDEMLYLSMPSLFVPSTPSDVMTVS